MSKVQDPQSGYMQLAGLGAVIIELNHMAGSPNVMHVDVAAERRLEVLHMETKVDETVDQFCQRLRGMMRALWQGEHVPEKPVEAGKEPIVSGLKKLQGKIRK